jgi:endonuclease/exonuclease/phosphatase family metal-dependent hydrolase
MSPGRPTKTLLLACATVAASCGFSPAMERAVPVGASCPAESRGRASAPPDTLSLRWYRAVDRRDVELASRWCAAVGDPVIRLTPDEDFPQWSEGGSLAVVTWNQNVGGGDLYALLANELGLECRDGPSGEARSVDPFVVLLQETWRYSDDLPVVEDESIVPWTVDPDRGPDGGADVAEVAERCGLALVYVPSTRNGPDTGERPREDKGNAILSTLPLTAPIALDLPFEAGRKVAVAASIRAPGGERMRVVSAHLDVASTLIRTLRSGNQTRTRQAEGLLDGLDEAERDGLLNALTLVGGDFNTWSSDETALKRLRRAFPHSPEWDGLPTWRPLDLPVDHVLFRRGPFGNVILRGYRRIDDPYGSDHFGRRVAVDYTASRAKA